MFFLFFGFGTRVKDHDELPARECPRCGNSRPWRRLEQYRYLSLFFVRVLRWQRRQLAACTVCGHTETLTGAHFLVAASPRPRPLVHA